MDRMAPVMLRQASPHSGQSAQYTAAQLTAYREGERRSDEVFGGMMRGVSKGLSDREIVVLSDYISGLN